MTFEQGSIAMARHCEAAVQLVKKGQWTLGDMERWLDAVIDNDAAYLKEVWPQIAAKVEK